MIDLDELFPFAWGEEEPCSECGDPTYLCNQWGRVVCRQCWGCQIGGGPVSAPNADSGDTCPQCGHSWKAHPWLLSRLQDGCYFYDSATDRLCGCLQVEDPLLPPTTSFGI